MPPTCEQRIEFWVGLIPYGSCQKLLLRHENCLVHYLFVMNGRRENTIRQFRWGIRNSFLIMVGVRHGNKLSRRVNESPPSETYKGGQGRVGYWYNSVSGKEGGMRCSPGVPHNCTCLKQKGRKWNYRWTETGFSCDEDVSKTSLSVGNMSLGNMQIPQDGWYLP